MRNLIVHKKNIVTIDLHGKLCKILSYGDPPDDRPRAAIILLHHIRPRSFHLHVIIWKPNGKCVLKTTRAWATPEIEKKNFRNTTLSLKIIITLVCRSVGWTKKSNVKPAITNLEQQTTTVWRAIITPVSVTCNNIIMVGKYLLPFRVVIAVAAAAAAAAAAAILLALPSTFWTCVGDSLAANAFSVCNMSTGFRDAGQSGRMGTTSGVCGQTRTRGWGGRTRLWRNSKLEVHTNRTLTILD